jgi:outer membrane protein insertion porin family
VALDLLVIRSSRSLVVVGAMLAAGAPARAQPDAPITAQTFDPAQCADLAPAATPQDATPDVPINWTELELEGSFVESVDTVRALLAPTMERHHALTRTSRAEIEHSINAFGYHVVGLGTRDAGGKTHAVLHIAPLPIVRRIEIDVRQSVWDKLFKAFFDDELKRRMRVRLGAYLPWSPVERACQLYGETQRIREFLQDEGYFEARATIEQKVSGAAVELEVEVDLGPAYTVDIERIQIPDAGALAVDVGEIREKFRHLGTCLLPKLICYGTPRFSRAQHQSDLQAVVELFHARGYPAVRVRSDYEPAQSIDRRTKKVRFSVTIDQRRRLDVVFEGQDSGLNTNDLRKQLTFNQASSTDDVEANDSARAITAYLQSRGYFDARVTWSRERFGVFDRLIYRIDQGSSRNVRSVRFIGNRAVSYADLIEVIGTKPERLSASLLGKTTRATAELLAGDVDRIVDLYRRRGYREARVRVSASTEPDGLDSAALTAALVLSSRGSGLHVRFAIDEGQPTLLGEIHVEVGAKGEEIETPDDRLLCVQVLRDLADLLGNDRFAKPAADDRCFSRADDVPFREDDVAATADQLKDKLYSAGRPRAEVAYAPDAIAPHRIAARYKLAKIQELRIGKVVIRGNFRTRDSIILGELRFREGARLTKDALADGARRLRNTALFDAVNIVMPDLDATSAGAVNAVVEVTERYDYLFQSDIELGYSTFNGMFVRAVPTLKNLFGRGISLEVAGTIGFELGKLIEDKELQLRQLSVESTLRFPQWLSRRISPVEFQTDITAFHRRQDTPRFGLLRTTGFTLALSRTWERPRIGSRAARAITLGPHYDFRSRERNVDALRPIGADEDESQVPITTRTGSVGIAFEWEQRVDRRGNLSPLAPDAGFRLDAQLSYAGPYLLGQDRFIKASAAVSKYWPLGTNLVMRADIRYDQGFPLGGAALLPEVERFFAGGDSTVRGYDDERLATEVVLVGVPPLDNVQQIRILPAGGNIRVIGSLDAQVRIYKLVASALFVDAGMIANQWTTVTQDDIRPSIGMALVRIVTPFGAFAFERAVPLRPRLGDDPRGRWHISFAARAQF